MTKDQLIQAYRRACVQASAYDGNDPERRKMLAEAVKAWAQELIKRGLQPIEIEAA